MKLRNLLEKKEKEIREKIESSNDANEVRELGETLKAVLEELKALDEAGAGEAGAGEAGAGEAGAGEEGRSAVPKTAILRNAHVIGSFAAQEEKNIEYRMAFMENVLRNTPIPAELRVDASTNTSDVSSVIPKELVNRIIEKFDNVGMILPIITKTSYAAGVEIPTSSIKPVASWVAEGAGSDRQKKTTGKITFSYFKLRCEISMSMEVGTMALSAFESKFVENVAKAMTYAIENAVINGTGSSQPKGILAETPADGQSLTPSAWSFNTLAEAEGVLPVEYETGAKWCMNKKTFAQIQGMVDSEGHPIARINYGVGKELERSILGRDVVVSPYVEDGVAFMFDFADYCLNTIYDMGISKKQDWDTEDLLTKAVMSVDGKCVDTGSLVKVKITPAV